MRLFKHKTRYDRLALESAIYLGSLLVSQQGAFAQNHSSIMGHSVQPIVINHHLASGNSLASGSALVGGHHQHHHLSNPLVPINLKGANEYANYFGLKPAINNVVSHSASQHLNSAVVSTPHHLLLNTTVVNPVSSNSQSVPAHVSNLQNEKNSLAVLSQAASQQSGENLNLASD